MVVVSSGFRLARGQAGAARFQGFNSDPHPMNITARLDLLEQIGAALQAKYTFNDLDAFFAALKIPTVSHETFGSKRVFAKEILKAAPDETLFRIAENRPSQLHPTQGAPLAPPRNWKNTTQFRIFISHISKDKDKATRLRTALEPYGISGFVAHEDIHPTAEWQIEIERACMLWTPLLQFTRKAFPRVFGRNRKLVLRLRGGLKLSRLKWAKFQPALFRSGRRCRIVAAWLRKLPRRSTRF